MKGVELIIKKNQAFIFDLDGTIYLGEDIIPGAVETLSWVRSRNSKVRFVTNNPRYSREFYADKLNNFGIDSSIDEIVTSANFTADYLKKNPEFGEVFVIGEQQLKDELKNADIPMVESIEADTVLVSFDTTLTYEKLQNAYLNLQKGARFIATNPDLICPTPQGGLLDAGITISALEKATNRKVEQVIGKPSKLLGELLIDDLNISSENCMMIGDRLNTDIKLGKQAKMKTAWIRANNEKIPNDINKQPDFILNSIAELPEVL